MKVKFWCDSGANIHSCREETVDTSDYGFSDEQWLALTEAEQFKIVREWANDYLEMGWDPLDEE